MTGDDERRGQGGHAIVTPGDDFRERTQVAVADPELQRALRNLDRRLYTARAVEQSHAPLKDRAAEIRRETLADLDGWLARLERSLQAVGAVVHRAHTGADACETIVDIVRSHDGRAVVKSKSMATEEIDLGNALERAGVRSIETDLGEYIVQLAGERPSHMITPAIHKTLSQIRDVLEEEAGAPLRVDRDDLTAWTRRRLREEFLHADVGITGVNFAAADTGTLVLVSNEGNARFCTTLPRIHIAVMPVEKVVPRFVDLATLLPLLTSSATGQPLSNYVTMITGPRRDRELDGPDELHVVFLDNRRSVLVGTPYEDMLACIRCGACLNVCPVYRHVGGHAYDAVYSGPMGKVLTPLLSDGVDGTDLPHGSSLCGACTEACPVQIPLADLLVRLRADLRGGAPLVAQANATAADAGDHERSRELHARLPGEGYASIASELPFAGRRKVNPLWDAWARTWSAPAGYRASTGLARVASRLVGRRGWARRVPGARGWTLSRDLPLPARQSFLTQWNRERR